MTGAILGLTAAFFGGLGIGVGLCWFVWQRRHRKLESYIQKVELSREDKVDRYQASLERIKERETKIEELRKEIYHKDQIIRNINRRVEKQQREGKQVADSISTFV